MEGGPAVTGRPDDPLTLEQLERMNAADREQLRARLNSTYVVWHPESRLLVLALLERAFTHPLPVPFAVSDEVRAAHAAWIRYYDHPSADPS